MPTGLAVSWTMRFVLFLFGIILGVGGTLAYVVLAHPADPAAIAAPVPVNAPITVTLGESFLTAVLRRSPPVAARATALRAELRDGEIVVHVAVDVLGTPTEGTAVLRPILRGGRLAIDVVSTNLGDLSIPAVDAMLDQQINARLASLLAGMPVTFTSVRVTPGVGLVVTCDVDLARLERVAAQPAGASGG